MSGGGSTIATTEPRVASLRIQSSVFGGAIPKVYGRARIPGNLIWYGNFVAIASTTTQSSGGKGGGGAVTQQNTTYTYEAAVMMALGQGAINGVVSAWRGKERLYGETVAGEIVTEYATVVASATPYTIPTPAEFLQDLGASIPDTYTWEAGYFGA